MAGGGGRRGRGLKGALIPSDETDRDARTKSELSPPPRGEHAEENGVGGASKSDLRQFRGRRVWMSLTNGAAVWTCMNGRWVAGCSHQGQVGDHDAKRAPSQTFTNDLLAMADWLAEAGCTHVAMESTGSYWKPVHNLLEGQFALIVVTMDPAAVGGGTDDV